MPKRRTPIAHDAKKVATSVSRPKIELSLGEKLKAAGFVEGSPDREDPAAFRVDSDSYCGRDSESRSDARQADSDALSRAYLGVRRLQGRDSRRARQHETSIGGVGAGHQQPDDGHVATNEFNLFAVPGFDIRWDSDGDVTALRRDFAIDELHSLFGNRFTPEAILDLHGTITKDLENKVTRFVRNQYRRGIRRLLLVHGKGKHSRDGVGVLADHLVKVLTQGRVSHYVRGFCTADLEHGGAGALSVMLIS